MLQIGTVVAEVPLVALAPPPQAVPMARTLVDTELLCLQLTQGPSHPIQNARALETALRKRHMSYRIYPLY